MILLNAELLKSPFLDFFDSLSINHNLTSNWDNGKKFGIYFTSQEIRQGSIKVLTGSKLHLQANIFAHVESKGGQDG